MLGSAVGVLLMVMGVVNLLMIPHPVWFWVASTLVYVPLAWMGGRIMQSKLHSQV